MNHFTNNSVEIASLPRAEDISFQSLDPSYKKVVLWEWALGWGITFLIAAVLIFFIKGLQNVLWITIIAGSLLFLSILRLWLNSKSFARKAYAVRDKDLIYRSGWLVQRLSICPFSRIQHCSVNSGPFERKLGLASLSVYTAGAMGSDIKIPGLPEAAAFALRDFIMKKTAGNEQSS